MGLAKEKKCELQKKCQEVREQLPFEKYLTWVETTALKNHRELVAPLEIEGFPTAKNELLRIALVYGNGCVPIVCEAYIKKSKRSKRNTVVFLGEKIDSILQNITEKKIINYNKLGQILGLKNLRNERYRIFGDRAEEVDAAIKKMAHLHRLECPYMVIAHKFPPEVILERVKNVDKIAEISKLYVMLGIHTYGELVSVYGSFFASILKRAVLANSYEVGKKTLPDFTTAFADITTEGIDTIKKLCEHLGSCRKGTRIIKAYGLEKYVELQNEVKRYAEAHKADKKKPAKTGTKLKKFSMDDTIIIDKKTAKTILRDFIF